MATITGTLNFVSEVSAAYLGVTFVPTETPSVTGSTLIVGQKKRVATESGGTLPTGLTLAEGRYTVQLDNDEEFEIDVPSGSGSHNIADLIVNPGTALSNYTISGVGSPEGVVQARPGYFYTDTSNGYLYRKRTGTGNTGWELLIS